MFPSTVVIPAVASGGLVVGPILLVVAVLAIGVLAMLVAAVARGRETVRAADGVRALRAPRLVGEPRAVVA